MRLSAKLFLVSLLGLSALTALFYFQVASRAYYENRNTIELSFEKLENAQNKLNTAVLRNAFYLYASQDEIVSAMRATQQAFDLLLENEHLQEHHPKTFQMLLAYQKQMQKRFETIYDFQTTSSTIKNSTAVLPVLQQKLFSSLEHSKSQHKKALLASMQMTGTILIAKNSMDAQLISSLKEKLATLRKFSFADPEQQNIFTQLLLHFEVIINNFEEYSEVLNQIKEQKLSTQLLEIQNNFIDETTIELRFLSYFSYFLVFLFLSSLLIITLFLLSSERKARRDTLTHLGNRRAYEERVRSTKQALGLLLVNIRKFKHYNDFYGVSAGDALLTATAAHLKSLPFSGQNPSYYRLGADDFGILFEPIARQPLEVLAQNLFHDFANTPLILEDEVYTPAIRVAASNFAPLLETADMALKNNYAQDVIVYDESLNLRQKIYDNVTKVQELKGALQNNCVVPYFQPLVTLTNNKVEKHEILARVLLDSGEICSIFPYLKVAKESNLYSQITQTILKQSFPIIAQSKGDFSLNLSIEDIHNPHIVEMIEQELQKYPEIAKRVIFEILESEAIEKYDEIDAFVQKMHTYGSKIAIDDFGSGYSNFAHILNLSVDIIKIDGSLIKHLDTDAKARTVVETILSFAHKSNMATVAEFVHNKEVAAIVKELDVDVAQGFYFYEPQPQPFGSIQL